MIVSSVPADHRFSLFSSLSWAVYLACSWTWCIGMFLPVLLVRDYGRVGWVIFAIPNVIGAAAMGWVLTRDSSERITSQHRSMCIAFSAITLAFHAFFLAWFAQRVIPIPACISAIIVGSALATLLGSRQTNELVIAWIVLAVSIIVLIHGLSHPLIATAQYSFNNHDLIYLALVCTFGFLLCPYLDLTFHRARQSTTNADSKLAFTLGFGVFFFEMIFLTLLYAGDLMSHAEGSFGIAGLKSWVALHICVQIGFTWMAHLRALPSPRKQDAPIWLAAALLAVVAGVLVWIPSLNLFQSHGRMLYTGEAIYRIFMAFYGLLFPAYVWVCVLPFGKTKSPNRRRLLAWIFGVLIATPMFWMAFLEGKMGWLCPGLAVVLVSRFAGNLRQVRSPSHFPETPSPI